MRTVLLLALTLCGCRAEDLASLEDWADDEVGLVERSHAVTLHFERGAAVLQVRRTFEHLGPLPWSDTRTLEVPRGAIATSFELRALGRALPAELLTTEEALARWDRLTAAPQAEGDTQGEAPAAPLGLLAWSSAGALELTLFAAPERGPVTVEYTLWLQPQPEGGALGFAYPFDGPAPTFALDAVPGARALEAEGLVEVTVPQVQAQPLSARWAVAALSAERALWRLELDAAPTLGVAPERPSVVFVIDASHSQGEAGIAAQLELLPAYLVHVPDAEVELVLYRRTAERLFGQFIPAGLLAQRLASLPPARLAPGNGSHLELGAEAAARALTQAAGPGRVVLFTDAQLSDSFSLDGAVAAVARAPAGTVTHVVVRRGGQRGALKESRDDGSPLAPLASAGGGVVLEVSGASTSDFDLAKAVEGLVRPIRIDALSVEAVGLTADTLEVPEALEEGRALRQMAFAEHPPSHITVRGRLWAQPVDAVLEVDAVLAHQLPGLALGDEGVEPQLLPEERLEAAHAAHAISSATAYLAAAPEAAPSSAAGGYGLHGVGTHGSCSCGLGFSAGGVLGPALDSTLLPTLRQLVRPIVARCPGAAHATLAVETTDDEIAEVEVAGATDVDCVREGVWALRLPKGFLGHRHFTLPPE